MARDPESVDVVLGGWFRDAACGGSSTSWGAPAAALNLLGWTWNEGPDRASDPSQDSSQGDNPNIALTRPHITGLLTLDDR